MCGYPPLCQERIYRGVSKQSAANPKEQGPVLGITSQEARLDLQGAGWPLLPGALILEARDLPHFSCWLLHSPEQNQPQG